MATNGSSAIMTNVPGFDAGSNLAVAVAERVGHVRTAAGELGQKAIGKLPGIILGLAILVVFWLLAKAAKRAIRHLARKMDPSAHDAVELMARCASGALIAVGIVFALDNAEVNVGPLIAGLGLTGFVIGFAVKDAITNTLCGVLLIMYRPFKRGDTVAITGIEGTVKALDLRYTTIVGDGKTYLIPNTTVFNSTITLIKRP